MAPTQKNADILLRYKVDRSSVNAVERANDAIITDVKQMNGGFRQLADGTYELSDATDNWVNNLRDLERQLDATTDSAEGLGRAGSSAVASGSRSSGGGLTDRVYRFGRFGTQIAGAFGGSEVGNVVGLIGDVAGGLGKLGPIAIGATAALAGVSLAMAEVDRQSQILHDNTIARLNAERSAAEFAETATTEQLQARRAELQSLAAAEAENIASLREQAIAFLFNENAISRVTTQLGILNSNAGILNAYREQIAEGTTRLSGYNAEQLTLNEALLAGTSITNDAAAATEAAAEAEREFLDAKVANALESQEEQARALEAVTAAGERYADQLEYEQKRALEAVTEASRRYADQLNYEAKQAALRNEETAREDYVKSIAEEAKLAADAAEAHDKYREGLDETAQQLAEAERERQEALAGIQDDYQREAVEAAEDLNDELVKITRDASDQLQDAVADRDALAFVQAKRQRDKDLQDAKQQDEKESRRRQQEFQREYNEEVSQSNRRYQQLVQSENRETQTRYQAYQQSLQQLAQASGAKLNLEQQYNNATLAAAGNFANSLRATYLSAFPTKGTIPTKGGGGKTLTIDFRGAQMPAFIAASKQQVFTELGNILSQQYGVK